MTASLVVKGLSVGAKILFKNLNKLIKKKSKTTKDKAKINELKKELKNEKSFKEKNKDYTFSKIKKEIKESGNKAASKTDRGDAKNQATRYESGRKQEIDDAYFKSQNFNMGGMMLKKPEMMYGGMAGKKKHMYAGGGSVTDNAGLRALKKASPMTYNKIKGN